MNSFHFDRVIASAYLSVSKFLEEEGYNTLDIPILHP